jgi:hypothetical protein
MKYWRILLCLCLGSLAGCSGEKKTQSVCSDIAKIRAFAGAQVKIEHLRRRMYPDWATIRNYYERASPIVMEIDRLCKTRYEKDIREALEKCLADEDPGVNQQVLAKGLQHVAVLALLGQLSVMATEDEGVRRSAAGCVTEYFEGIRPTFQRRDKDYFKSVPTLEKAALQALERLRTAAGQGQTEVLAARRALEHAIWRTYALSVLYEVEEIEKLIRTDRSRCEVKRMEAVIFYRILAPEVERRDREAHKVLSRMLLGSLEGMTTLTVLDCFEKGLPNVPLK